MAIELNFFNLVGNKATFRNENSNHARMSFASHADHLVLFTIIVFVSADPHVADQMT
jgi:hypothetical protein